MPMTSINLVLRPSSKEGRHAGSLSLRVVHNRKSRMIVTGCRLYMEEWDAETRFRRKRLSFFVVEVCGFGLVESKKNTLRA